MALLVPLPWGSKHSTGTTTRPIFQKTIALQWVCSFISLLVTTTSNNTILVLHPRHKLKYFENAGWEEEWIETARQIVRDEFDRTYAFMDIAVDEAHDKSEYNVREFLSFISILLLILVISKMFYRPRICSTTFQHSPLHLCWNSGMNSINTFPPIRNKWVVTLVRML